MKLYNTLTKTVDPFLPRDPKTVKMYTCGPTVYHFAHIGNLRTYLMEDVLERYLRFEGYTVERVMNITDVGHLAGDTDTGEDKMLAGARREHKSVYEIASYYENAFFEDCRRLNIRKPEKVVPATSCIEDFISVIKTLLDKGFAYPAGGNIYFDTSKVADYYTLTGHSAEALKVGVREDVGEDANKRNKSDFVLWFTKSKFEDQELKWNSPWGVGYPGWHIECSTISMRELGDYLDLHCGGVDNIFPHHTNEIAQSEAYLGHPWCGHWFHVHHLNDETGKMSKSKGEFLTLSLLEKKGYDPLAYRYFCLESHYRKPLTFSFEGLDNAASAYRRLISRTAALPREGEEEEARLLVEKYREEMRRTVGNDLNTAMGITLLYNILKEKAGGRARREALALVDEVLGLSLLEKADALSAAEGTAGKLCGAAGCAKECAENGRPAAPDTRENGADGDPEAEEIEALIARRAAAKKEKNYAEADAIRAALAERGVTLTDTPAGTVWSRR